MPLSAADRLAIHELINLHGHLMDSGEFDRLEALFVDEVIYDLQDFGGGTLVGIGAIRDAALALGDRNPLAHHVTNIVVSETHEDAARVLSKGIAVRADGTTGSVTYLDDVKRGSAGWRIASRRVTPRRVPLQP